MPGGILNNRFSIEPHRAPLTPSASPSVAPPDRPPTKRPRLRSTPSSCVSATPSTSNDSTSSADVDSARRASTFRVLNVWAQLAERYNKRLDEDDIVDLYSGTIIKDRGVCRGASREYHFGHVAHPDGDVEGDQDQEDSEQDEDEDELNPLPPSEVTDDDVPISKKELLRGVPPLSSTTDAEDLREFLEAEKKRRELAGDEEDEDLPMERLFAMRKALEEQSQEEETATVTQGHGETSAHHSSEPPVDNTPRRLASRAPPSEDESEDELAVWVHDESTAVFRAGPGQDARKRREEPEVIELSDSSESDREFEAILTRPARFVRPPPLPIPHTKEVKQPLQSPPDSERGRSKSRTRPQPRVKSKAEVTPKSENRPRSPLALRRPEVILPHKGKPSVSKEASDDDDESVMRRIPSAHKGKGKEVQTPVDDDHLEKTPKSLGVVSRGRKRKRIASSTSGGPLSSPADQKDNSRSPRGKSTSQITTTLPQPDTAESTLVQDVSTPSRPERTITRRSRSFSMSKAQPPTPSASAYRSPEPESIQPILHNYNSNRALPPDPTIAVTHPYLQRYPSSIFSSPNQATPGPSHPGPLPPPLDPVQTQQAHYLLAQAMQQLSYILSAMPPYPAYAPNPGQPWHPPQPHMHPPPPLAAYSTPIHHPSHIHDTRAYHTPSSSISHAGLPPSSPVQSSVSPMECPKGRGRSKSRGRRVSFKDSDEVAGGREPSIQPEPGPKKRTQIVEGKREGKEKATDVFDEAFREDRGGPPEEISRGRTPGPPNRKKGDVSRARSLSRR